MWRCDLYNRTSLLHCRHFFLLSRAFGQRKQFLILFSFFCFLCSGVVSIKSLISVISSFSTTCNERVRPNHRLNKSCFELLPLSWHWGYKGVSPADQLSQSGLRQWLQHWIRINSLCLETAFMVDNSQYLLNIIARVWSRPNSHWCARLLYVGIFEVLAVATLLSLTVSL